MQCGYANVIAAIKRLLTVSVYVLESFLIALTHSITMLIVMRFIQGLAGASGQVLSRAVARDLFSGHALTNFYAILNAVNGVFPIIAPIIGGYMIQFVPWQAIFILLGAIGLVLSGLIVVGIPETLTPGKRLTGPIFATFKSFGNLVKMPGFDNVATLIILESEEPL